jgi:hypothetical protein
MAKFNTRPMSAAVLTLSLAIAPASFAAPSEDSVFFNPARQGNHCYRTPFPGLWVALVRPTSPIVCSGVKPEKSAAAA